MYFFFSQETFTRTIWIIIVINTWVQYFILSQVTIGTYTTNDNALSQAKIYIKPISDITKGNSGFRIFHNIWQMKKIYTILHILFQHKDKYILSDIFSWGGGRTDIVIKQIGR